jgi:iron complex outermembrane receptor protein
MIKRSSRSKLCMSALVAASVAEVLHPVPVRAEQALLQVRTVQFSVPRQQASSGILEFARQAGIQILVPERILNEKYTAEVQGGFTVAHGLEALLTGTGLVVASGDDKTVTLQLASFRTAYLASAADAPADTTTSSSELEEVVVQGLSFRDTQEANVLKMPLSIKDTPQSVITVTEDMIEFAGIHKFEDIYKVDASGGTSFAGDQNPRNYYRGFLQQGVNTIKVDGFRMNADIDLDLAAFERFEVIKGANSTLYGQSPVGGTLNAISKKPMTGPVGGTFSVQGGSYDFRRGEVDLHGSLSADDRLSFRLVSAYQDAGSFIDHAFSDVVLVAPTLQYQVSDDTLVRLAVNYQRNEYLPTWGPGVHLLDDQGAFELPDIPRSRNTNIPWGTAEKDALFVNGILEHSFGDDWQLRGSLQYNSVEGLLNNAYTSFTDTNGLTTIYAYMTESDSEVYASEINLFGDVEMFGREHTLFVGADYARLSNERGYRFGPPYLGSETGFSILDPDYSLLVPRYLLAEDYPLLSHSTGRLELMGVSAQAILRPVDALQVILGARYSKDEIESRSICCGLSDPLGPVQTTKEDAITFQAGATYGITKDINLYASYGETYEPNRFGQTTADGRLIDPEEGESKEVGAKGELFSRRLLWTLAFFDVERSGIAGRDPLNPNFVIPIGTQRSRGVEFDARGEVLPGWDVFLSVASLDAEFIDGDADGARPINAPKFGLSLFTNYEIQSGALRGLGFGIGTVHKSGREVESIYSRGVFFGKDVFDDFTEVDLRMFYNLDKWRFDVDVTNVTNELYYSGAFGWWGNGFNPNPPRQIKGRVTYQF